MEQEFKKNGEKTQGYYAKCGNSQDNWTGGDFQGIKRDEEMKDDSKDGEAQDIKSDAVMADSSKNNGANGGVSKDDEVMHGDGKDDRETKESKRGDKLDDEEGVEGVENDGKRLKDDECDADASNNVESSERGASTLLKPRRKVVKKSQSVKRRTSQKKPMVDGDTHVDIKDTSDGVVQGVIMSVGLMPDNSNGGETQVSKRDGDKQEDENGVDLQNGFENERQKQEDDKQDVRVEPSEKGASKLLKPKRKFVKKSQVVKLKTSMGKPLVDEGATRIKNDGVMQEGNNVDGVVQETNSGDLEKLENGSEEKQDVEKGVGQQEGRENEQQNQERNKKDAKASTNVESSENCAATSLKPKRKLVKVVKLKPSQKKPLADGLVQGGETPENNSREKPDVEKGIGQQEGFEKERQKEKNEKDAKPPNKVEPSEKGVSMSLKPKKKLVKKFQAVKSKAIPKMEGVASNLHEGEEGKQKQNSDDQPPENHLHVESPVVKDTQSPVVKDTRKRPIEHEPSLKIMDTAEQSNQNKRPRIGIGENDLGFVSRMKSGEGCEQNAKSDGKLPQKSLLAELKGGEATQKSVSGVTASPNNKGNALKLEKGKKKPKNRKSRRVDINQKNKARDDEQGKNLTNEMRKDRCIDKGKGQTNDTIKEKLGGLIFMCNGKTKPDCFRYRVMGVSHSKEDIVMGVRPGLKLFLFDFDLKLLYGIYSASSSGGMKLEPKAFGGSFPVQVRFNIDRDCFPLPESIFKKAIKENYDKNNKFKTELTIRQVRKLRELFRPVGLGSLHPVHSPPRSTARDHDHRDTILGGHASSWGDAPGRDQYGTADAKNYNMLSQGRNQHLAHRDATLVRREESPRDLFLTENKYRAYGLQGKRRNLTPPSLGNPTLGTYGREYSREDRLNPREFHYRGSAPTRNETRHSDALYMSEKDYRTHGLISPDNPYYADRYGTSSSDLLPRHPRMEDVATGSYGRMLIEDNNMRRETAEDRLYSGDDFGMRETARDNLYSRNDLRRREPSGRERLYSTEELGRNEEDRLYSRYASDALADRNRTGSPLSHRTLHEAACLPVSSRYSFAGPSYTRR